MNLYIAPNSTYNTRYDYAKRLMEQRRLVGLNSFSLALFGNNGTIVPENEFGDEIWQAIANSTKMNFNIQHVEAIDNSSSPDVPAVGSYINVGLNAKIIKDFHPDLEGAIKRMIDNDYPNESDDQVRNRIDNMPGVADSRREAIEASWYGVGE